MFGFRGGRVFKVRLTPGVTLRTKNLYRGRNCERVRVTLLDSGRGQGKIKRLIHFAHWTSLTGVKSPKGHWLRAEGVEGVVGYRLWSTLQKKAPESTEERKVRIHGHSSASGGRSLTLWSGRSKKKINCPEELGKAHISNGGTTVDGKAVVNDSNAIELEKKT